LAYLTHTDPNRNVNRFYVVDITRRCSANGRYCANGVGAAHPAPCASTGIAREEAQSAEQRTIKRRLQRGYR
jgi:predicted DNA-binding WGR domain protein